MSRKVSEPKTVPLEIVEKNKQTFSWFISQGNFLEGKILTVIDASISDKEQREAVKSLMKNEVREWRDWVFELLIWRDYSDEKSASNPPNPPVTS